MTRSTGSKTHWATFWSISRWAIIRARTFGEFDQQAITHEVLAVEITNRVFGVSRIIEFDEAESSHQSDVIDTAKWLEEIFDIGSLR